MLRYQKAEKYKHWIFITISFILIPIFCTKALHTSVFNSWWKCELIDISSSMKISLLWRFGLYALGLLFPIFPSQLISAFHSDTLSISATHKTVIVLHKTSSLFCAEARNMNFWTVGLLEAIQSAFFCLIPSVLHNQVPQQAISCKNTVKIGSFLHKASTSDLDRFQGYCHYNESQ